MDCELERESSTKASLGSDGDAAGGRCCSGPFGAAIATENHSSMPLIGTASPRRAVEHYASGTATPTRLLLSLFRVARLVGTHAPVLSARTPVPPPSCALRRRL